MTRNENNMTRKIISIKLIMIILLSLITVFHVSAVDDYPYRDKSYGTYRIPEDVDPWSMFYRECTSFAAWCLSSRNGYEFDRGGKGSWNANLWGKNAHEMGFVVDMNPAVGAIAWWETKLSHVAWVAQVNGDEIVIEEYNYGTVRGIYNTRTIKADSVDGYIHFKDIEIDVEYIPTITITRENAVYSVYDYEVTWAKANELASEMGGALLNLESVNGELITALIDGRGLDLYWSVDTGAPNEKRGFVVVAANKPSAKKGDVNGNGIIEIQDAIFIFKYLAGKTELTAPEFIAADLDLDGAVTIQDAIIIFKYLAGKVEI